VVQVTSPRSADGTTLTATNLAVAVAASGKQVVLVDANFAAPRIGALFGERPRTGLGTLLRGAGPLERFLTAAATPNLMLLRAEDGVIGAEDLLAGPSFADTIRFLRERFDMVIIDGPAVLCGAGASTLVSVSDAVLLAVNLRRTDRQDAERSVEMLRNVRAKILGIVVNEATPDR
jgi:capsular exopolysaccharide synthesis family protein